MVNPYSIHSIVQKFGVSKKSFFVWKDIKNFIQQGHIKLLKSDSKDIHNVTKASDIK